MSYKCKVCGHVVAHAGKGRDHDPECNRKWVHTRDTVIVADPTTGIPTLATVVCIRIDGTYQVQDADGVRWYVEPWTCEIVA